MKTVLLGFILICLSAQVFGQSRLVTLMVDGNDPESFTSEVVVGSFESAKLVSYPGTLRCGSIFEVVKSGKTFRPITAPCTYYDSPQGLYDNLVITGPATLRL